MKVTTLKTISLCVLSLLQVLFAVLLLTMEAGLPVWLKWLCAIGFALLAIALIVLYFLKFARLVKLLVIVAIVAIIVAVGYHTIYVNGWLIYFSSMAAIKELILSFGMWGVLSFIVLQFLQVVLLPIPAMLSTLAGVAIFGPWLAMFYSGIGVIAGSLLAFVVGRVFGRRLVVWVAGEEQTKKYSDLLNNKGKYLLILMFLFPMFPDDLLCMIAGITAMSFRFFLFSCLIVRPIGIVVTCFVGSGQLIPYSGWGLIVWPILIVLLVVTFILCWKYQEKIEQFLLKLVGKKTVANQQTETKTENAAVNIKKPTEETVDSSQEKKTSKNMLESNNEVMTAKKNQKTGDKENLENKIN